MTFRVSKSTLERLGKLARAHGISQSDCLDYWVKVASDRPGSVRIDKDPAPRPLQLCIWASEGTSKAMKALSGKLDVSQGDLVEFFVNQAWKEGKR